MKIIEHALLRLTATSLSIEGAINYDKLSGSIFKKDVDGNIYEIKLTNPGKRHSWNADFGININWRYIASVVRLGDDDTLSNYFKDTLVLVLHEADRQNMGLCLMPVFSKKTFRPGSKVKSQQDLENFYKRLGFNWTKASSNYMIRLPKKYR